MKEKSSAGSQATASTNAVMEREDYGHWCQLAVVYDSRAGSATHYKNGQKRGTATLKKSDPLVFGPTQIANCQLQTDMTWRVRNLHAQIGELCFLSRALSADEIKRLYDATAIETGKPKPGS
jgi:hypothetical protein